jgi:hypothetical protein
MSNKNLKRQMIEVVNNQISDLNPPITAETYNRLIEAGYSDKTAKEKIASIVLEEIYDVLKSGKQYYEIRYSERLMMLN